jgi:pyruvate dehydrogenase (quinone)
VLIDAMVDGYEPMLPPKRRPKYMENLKKALDRGTPNRERIEAALGQEPLKTELQD